VNPDVNPATRVTDAPATTLARRVLAELEAAGIAHCHWKSNDHLLAALSGDTDIDLLVDGQRIDDVYRIFAGHDLRRGRVAATRTEMGLEDFLGHDETTGALVHFHTHYRLVTGERHLKRYRLPWERAVLASAVRSDSGVLVPHPSVEASLLLIRAALKIRVRDRIRSRLGRRDLSGWFRAELDALRAASSDADIVARVGSWLGEPCAEAVADALAHGIDSGGMVRLRSLVRRSLALQTAYRGPGARVRRWRREWAWFQRGVSRRYLDRPRLFGRGLPGGGLVVVVIGPDGSGKSSIVADLRRWFSPKFDTMAVYFGSGDGPSSLLRWPMKALRDRVPDDRGGTAAPGEHGGSRRPGWAKVLWALALAREKRRRLQRAFDARHRGMLVICDRYPQAQRPGINDGPLLHRWSGGGARGRIARWEAGPYELAERFPPDLVVRLEVDQRTAERRRPGHDPDDLARRRALVAGLAFPQARYGTVEIDASQPYSQVLEAVKAAVWRCL
jgi:thymidylate kinase